MTVHIRVARVSDADHIANLTAELGYDVEPSLLRMRLSRILARSDHQFLVAEIGGRPVGWLHAAIAGSIETDPFVWIGGLVVSRRHRKQGIGRLLMAHAESWATEQGCGIVRLWSSSLRADAHRFYEHLGYSNVKTQFSFVKALDPARQAELMQFVPRVDGDAS